MELNPKRNWTLYDLPKELLIKILTSSHDIPNERSHYYTSSSHDYVDAPTLCDICATSCFGFIMCKNFSRWDALTDKFNITYTCLSCCVKCIDCGIYSCNDRMCSKRCNFCNNVLCKNCGEECDQCKYFYCKKCRQENDSCDIDKCYICARSQELEVCRLCSKYVCPLHSNDCPARCGIHCRNCSHNCGGC